MTEKIMEKACREDADQILELYQKIVQSAVPTTWNQYYPTMEEIEFDLQAEGLYVLRQDGQAVAAVSLVEHDDLDDEPMDWTNGKSCAMARLCVDPALQGQGIGEWMARSALERARETGVEWVRLLVAMDNMIAEHIYRKIGFRKTGETEMYGHRYYAYECKVSD